VSGLTEVSQRPASPGKMFSSQLDPITCITKEISATAPIIPATNWQLTRPVNISKAARIFN